MTTAELREESLSRAIGGMSTSNFGLIIDGFMARGIPADDIRPRENVFTYNAWLALGRQVRKGEHGVKILTWVPMDKKVPEGTTGRDANGKLSLGARPKSTTVFHITQTDAI